MDALTKVPSQYSQWKSSIYLWVESMCLWRLFILVNDLPHISQEIRFWWTWLMWLFKYFLFLKLITHLHSWKQMLSAHGWFLNDHSISWNWFHKENRVLPYLLCYLVNLKTKIWYWWDIRFTLIIYIYIAVNNIGTLFRGHCSIWD